MSENPSDRPLDFEGLFTQAAEDSAVRHPHQGDDTMARLPEFNKKEYADDYEPEEYHGDTDYSTTAVELPPSASLAQEADREKTYLDITAQRPEEEWDYLDRIRPLISKDTRPMDMFNAMLTNPPNAGVLLFKYDPSGMVDYLVDVLSGPKEHFNAEALKAILPDNAPDEDKLKVLSGFAAISHYLLSSGSGSRLESNFNDILTGRIKVLRELSGFEAEEQND